MKKVLNPLWEEIKDERLICLNKQEYFVIKTNDFRSSESKKSATAYSLEYKLGKIDISFEDSFLGVEKDIVITRQETCTVCHGTGAKPGTNPIKCPTCGGTGQIKQMQNTIL